MKPSRLWITIFILLMLFSYSQSDTSGGWGANYIIKWESEKEVNEPIIESVTFGARGAHTISFISRGKAIKE